MVSRAVVWRQPLSLVVLTLLVVGPVLILVGPRLLGIAVVWAGVLVGGLVLSRAPRRSSR